MIRSVAVLSGILILLTSAPGAAPAAVGSLVGQGVRLDGQPVATGTTVTPGAVIETDTATATIHATAGGLVQIAPETRVQVGTSYSEILVSRGSARVRTPDGTIRTFTADGAAAAQGQQRARVDPNVGQGQVARLAAATSANSSEIRVNSSERILSTAPILIRSAATPSIQFVYYIRSVDGQRVRLTANVGRSFQPGDLVFQGGDLDDAIAAGATIVGGPSSGGGGLSTGAIVGILIGVGAGAGAAAAAAGGGGGSSAPPGGSLVTPGS